MVKLLGSPWYTTFCLSLAWALSTLMVGVFAIAAVSQDHRIVVTVNQYHEMLVEVVLFGVAWLLITANLVALWNMRRNR